MTEEVKLEDLQKQVLDLQKKLEEQTTAASANAEKLKETEETLKKARDLNADLMNRVPGSAPEQPKDEYSDMSDEEFLRMAIEKTVDEVAAQNKKKV